MIELIIFDMDGVLVDARELHYKALNRALKSVGKEYVINREEHLAIYDGLPTKKKLQLLTKNKGLPEKQYNEVWQNKQQQTIELISAMSIDHRISTILSELKNNGYKIYVASNSVKHTIKMMLLKKGLIEFVDDIFSNEDVTHAKPHPEIYLRCMVRAGVGPTETLIIEDSHVGRQSAIESGAHLFAVKNPTDVILQDLQDRIDTIDRNQKTIKPKWQGGKMNVLIPMAGAGSRFVQAGYTFPKPLIDINGKTMIETVVENINIDAKHIFIVQKAHYEKYNLKTTLNNVASNCEIIQTNGITEGAACTTLLAKKYINNNEPLLIANSDQFVEWNSNEFMYAMIGDNIDAGILTFKSRHPKWSYAKVNDNGFVTEVQEKNPISDIATVGIYYWAKGSDYVKYAEQMIKKEVRVNNEFYVCPVFNEAIADAKKIKIFNIKKMWGLGTPEDLQSFLKIE